MRRVWYKIGFNVMPHAQRIFQESVEHIFNFQIAAKSDP